MGNLWEGIDENGYDVRRGKKRTGRLENKDRMRKKDIKGVTRERRARRGVSVKGKIP